MSQVEVELLGVYPPRQDEKNPCICRCSFSYVPSRLTPTIVSRDFKKGDEWKSTEVCTIQGAMTITVHSATVRMSPKDHRLFLTCDVSLSRDISQRVIELVEVRLAEHQQDSRPQQQPATGTRPRAASAA